MNVRFFNPGLGYKKIKKEIDKEMQRVLKAGDLILRKDGEKFEEDFAKYVGTKYAVAVASGTDALILALTAAGIGEGDEVLCPSYTFRATVEAVHRVGATPVLYDLDGKMILTDKTKAFIPAHIAGEVTKIASHIMDYLHEKGIVIIEDACQAVGAAPVFGVMACYSFYPAKILGCYGDGGAIATNNEELYTLLKQMRNHFKDSWSDYGFNSRLDNLQAAVLNVKLKYLPDAITRRKEIAVMYDTGLDTSKVGLPNERAVYQDYIITHENVADLQTYLKEQGIETMLNGYPFPSELVKGEQTQEYEAKSLRLPCNPDLTDEEIAYVIAHINAF